MGFQPESLCGRRRCGGFIDFVVAVFGAHEVAAARTPAPNGLLIHGELELGDSLQLLADTQPGWASRPGLFQVWVSSIERIIEEAAPFDPTVVWPPTPFYGAVTLARMQDRWNNLWWMYQPSPGQADPTPAWEGGGSDVIFRTIDEYMRELPR